jgi:DNA polymerase III delta prime subunit
MLSLLSKLDSTGFPPNTLIIGTANDTENLEARLLSRFRVIEFSSYGCASAIAEHLEKIWRVEGGSGDVPDLARITKDSRNNVRDALLKLEIEMMAV